VQATVRSFHPDSREGDVLLDDGRVMTFDAAAFDRSGLRLLRSGQRVRLEIDAAGRVDLVTMPSDDTGTADDPRPGGRGSSV
jgi:hypothetical protein